MSVEGSGTGRRGSLEPCWGVIACCAARRFWMKLLQSYSIRDQMAMDSSGMVGSSRADGYWPAQPRVWRAEQVVIDFIRSRWREVHSRVSGIMSPRPGPERRYLEPGDGGLNPRPSARLGPGMGPAVSHML